MTPRVAFVVKLWACVLAGIVGLNCDVAVTYCLLRDQLAGPRVALAVGFSVGLFQCVGLSLVAKRWCDGQVLSETCRKK